MTHQQQIQKCTIRIDISGSRSTGFFVAPNLILKCHHVVVNNSSIPIFWKETKQKYNATVKESFKYPVDLALLKLDDNLDGFSLKPHFFRTVGGIEFIKYLAGKLPFYTQMLGSILWQKVYTPYFIKNLLL